MKYSRKSFWAMINIIVFSLWLFLLVLLCGVMLQKAKASGKKQPEITQPQLCKKLLGELDVYLKALAVKVIADNNSLANDGTTPLLIVSMEPEIELLECICSRWAKIKIVVNIKNEAVFRDPKTGEEAKEMFCVMVFKVMVVEKLGKDFIFYKSKMQKNVDVPCGEL